MFNTQRLKLWTAAALLTSLGLAAAAVAQDEGPSKVSRGLHEDAAVYAKRFDVSLDEAVRRLRVQSTIGELEADLAREEWSTFAGMWLEHEPSFRLVLSFTENGKTLRSYTLLRDEEIEVRSAEWTLAQLEEDQAAARELAQEHGFTVDADLNVPENRVEIYVVEDHQTSGLRSFEADLPASVWVVGVPRLATADQAQQLEGGALITGCTAGFTVRNGAGEMGISTAAHCGNAQTALGQALTFRSEDQQGNQDVQWHSACNILDVSNNFNSGLGVRATSGTQHRDNQAIGSFVCKFGRTTGHTCGTIESRSYAPSYVSSAASTFVRIDGGTINSSDPGDSGGPWFVDTVAWGIHSGTPGSDANDSLYMPINFISSLGVSVLTTDPAGPACNLCSVTLCGGSRPPCCAGACVPSGLGGLFMCQ